MQYSMSTPTRFFPKLPNQVTEPDTNETVSTPQPTAYPSFPSLSTLVSTELSFPHPSPPSQLLFSHPPTPFPVITRHSTNQSPVLCKELHITIPHAIPSPQHTIALHPIDTSIKYAIPESSPHFSSTNKCCFQQSP